MPNYRFQLHHCKNCETSPSATGHFHIILGPRTKNVSWPFWSAEAADKIMSFMVEKMAEGDRHFLAEIESIKGQLVVYKKMQIRTPQGRFGRHLMPRSMQPGEVEVAHTWRSISKKKEGSLGYFQWHVVGCFWHPVQCDFLEPLSERKTYNLLEVDKVVAETKGRLRTLEEVGIKIVEI